MALSTLSNWRTCLFDSLLGQGRRCAEETARARPSEHALRRRGLGCEHRRRVEGDLPTLCTYVGFDTFISHGRIPYRVGHVVCIPVHTKA